MTNLEGVIEGGSDALVSGMGLYFDRKKKCLIVTESFVTEKQRAQLMLYLYTLANANILV